MEIVTRLLLKTNQFDANLKGAKNSVGSFESDIASMASKAGSSVLKFAGGIGVATTAGEAFNKVLHSSQVLGDTVANNMYALKTSVDQFFYSIGAGEFNSFIDGLNEIIRKAKEAESSIDQLGNTRISHSYFSAENEGKIAESQYIAKNKFAPLDDRTKAFDNWKSGLEAQADINKTLQSDLIKAITRSVEAEIGAGKIKVGMDDVRMSLKIDVTNPEKRQELKKQYSSDYTKYNKEKNNAYALLEKESIGKNDSERMHASFKYNETLGILEDKYRSAIIVNAMLNKYKDEELTNIANMGIEYQKLSSSLASTSREYNETANEFNNANKAVKGFTEVASLEGYKTYTGVNSEAAVKAREAANQAEAKRKEKLFKKNEIKWNAEGWAKQEALGGTQFKQPLEQPLKITPLPITIDEIADEALPKTDLEIKLKAKLENYEFAKKKIEELKALMEVTTDKKEKNQLKGQIGEWEKFVGIIDNKDINLNNDYAESLDNISRIMGTLSGVTNESAGAWLSWSANTLSAISKAIPAIISLTTAKTADAAAEAAGSAAKIPFVGWLAAGGAALSVVAAMASIPKCANGGIAYGNSLVNVGEYAGASGNPEVIAPLSKLREYIQPKENAPTIGGEVNFVIKGTNLVGVINNHNKRQNKI